MKYTLHLMSDTASTLRVHCSLGSGAVWRMSVDNMGSWRAENCGFGRVCSTSVKRLSSSSSSHCAVDAACR